MSLNRISRLPRVWSNKELLKFSHLFTGSIINVSGWKDIDKMGNYYRKYFINAESYFISNFESKYRGVQDFENEIILDLSIDLDPKYFEKFDVVFNHTTLEHIYQVKKAFKNLCLLSRDIVIIVVPFLQVMHGLDYGGDYWRFTPLTIKKLFEENNLELLYLNFNNHKFASVYIFAIGSKNPSKWRSKIKYKFVFKKNGEFIGKKIQTRVPFLIEMRSILIGKIRAIHRINKKS